jgi:putative RNA 2'-phosphotransferase
MNDVTISKFLSLVLRHQPETIGLTLDTNGWTDLDELVECARSHGKHLTTGDILRVTANNDKKRFTLSEDSRPFRPGRT